MKRKLLDASQIVLAIILTGSVAFAMEPPVQPVTENNTAPAVVEAAKPQATQEPVKEPVAEEQPQVQPKAETAPVAPPVAPATPAPAPITGGKADWMAAAGIPENAWSAVDYIISKESGWCPTKWNGQRTCPDVPTENIWGDGGYGLCQSTPAEKMASAGDDWKTNPVTQLKWCSSYAEARYGSWAGAANYWTTHHVW